MAWTKLTQKQLEHRVFSALEHNINYNEEHVVGIPASHLDEKVFHQDAAFLKNAPYISTLVQNPNHIGCHTLNSSESFFAGTQEIEREMLDICAVGILKAKEGEYDGYLASGGTEANIQAIWIYRNYFEKEFGASPNQISILCTEDCHYSMFKAANLLSVDIATIPVDKKTRQPSQEQITETIQASKDSGKQCFIVICNMMTTMFGSVDDVNLFVAALQETDSQFKLHVDGAYGGFYYPFANEDSNLTFANKHISSFTMDAHKMAQAPYGTGIFLIRKNFMQYAVTKEASYVKGDDYTLIGSRSGANAIAVWMILCKTGPHGYFEKVLVLQNRTDWLCKALDKLSIAYYRNPHSNIVTMDASRIPKEVAEKYGLVPDKHENPTWYKVVIMEHVTIEKLALVVADIKSFQQLPAELV